ncbi:MAG: hypothetical protein ACSLEN_01175 [Candidatus Malihini olakiniferum]
MRNPHYLLSGHTPRGNSHMEQREAMNIPVFVCYGPRVYFSDKAMEALRAYNHQTVVIVTDEFMTKSGKTDYLAGFMP